MHTFDSDKPETYKTCTCREYVAHVKAVLDHTDASEDVAALAFYTGRFLQEVTSAFEDARQLFEQALKMRRELAKGEDSSSVASCYFSIGSVLFSQGKYEEALQNYQKAEKIYVAGEGCESLAASCTSSTHPSPAANRRNGDGIVQKWVVQLLRDHPNHPMVTLSFCPCFLLEPV
jgi:hypothetical protein